MKQTKLTYLSPVTETLVVQSEGSMCNNPSFSNVGTELIIIDTDEDF
ncbi:MAG: hypothetical protein IK008_04390 [Bacteroidales bacterium]|nr:hypothetical protein [Bacteroidales bacterium]